DEIKDQRSLTMVKTATCRCDKIMAYLVDAIRSWHMRIAIVCGGGVAGLSAAIALARTGWSVDVLERSSAVREIGAGIFIKPNALRVLESFGVLERIRQ